MIQYALNVNHGFVTQNSTEYQYPVVNVYVMLGFRTKYLESVRIDFAKGSKHIDHFNQFYVYCLLVLSAEFNFLKSSILKIRIQ